jgi:hypothetical protein
LTCCGMQLISDGTPRNTLSRCCGARTHQVGTAPVGHYTWVGPLGRAYCRSMHGMDDQRTCMYVTSHDELVRIHRPPEPWCRWVSQLSVDISTLIHEADEPIHVGKEVTRLVPGKEHASYAFRWPGVRHGTDPRRFGLTDRELLERKNPNDMPRARFVYSLSDTSYAIHCPTHPLCRVLFTTVPSMSLIVLPGAR